MWGKVKGCDGHEGTRCGKCGWVRITAIFEHFPGVIEVTLVNMAINPIASFKIKSDQGLDNVDMREIVEEFGVV